MVLCLIIVLLHLYIYICICDFIIHICVFFQTCQVQTKKPGQIEACLMDMNVTRKDDRFCAFLVKPVYAKRFLANPPDLRKIMDIRKSPISFLNTGDRVLLTQLPTDNMMGRCVLAVLEFQACMQIHVSQFAQYYPLHTVTSEEFDPLYKSWGRPDYVYGYQFSLHHVFEDPLVYTGTARGQVWHWIDPDHLQRDHKVEETVVEHESDVDGEQDGSVQNQSDASDDEGKGMTSSGENVTCLLLSDTEWSSISTCKNGTAAIFRPLQTTSDTDIVAIVRGLRGYRVVGQFRVLSCKSLQGQWRSKAVTTTCANLKLTPGKIASMKESKKMWLWQLEDVNKWEPERLARFVDVAPRYKNRPFVLPSATLQAIQPVSKIPIRQNLKDTARFFLNQFEEKHSSTLMQTVLNVASRTGKIRVGTTCSGTDICVRVLKETVDVLNKIQAGKKIVFRVSLLYIHENKHIYI